MYVSPVMPKEIRIHIGFAMNGLQIYLDRCIIYLYDDSISFMALLKSLFYLLSQCCYWEKYNLKIGLCTRKALIIDYNNQCFLTKRREAMNGP